MGAVTQKDPPASMRPSARAKYRLRIRPSRNASFSSPAAALVRGKSNTPETCRSSRCRMCSPAPPPPPPRKLWPSSAESLPANCGGNAQHGDRHASRLVDSEQPPRTGAARWSRRHARLGTKHEMHKFIAVVSGARARCLAVENEAASSAAASMYAASVDCPEIHAQDVSTVRPIQRPFAWHVNGCL